MLRNSIGVPKFSSQSIIVKKAINAFYINILIEIVTLKSGLMKESSKKNGRF